MEQTRLKLVGYFNQRLHLLMLLDSAIDRVLGILYTKSLILFNIPKIATEGDYVILIDVISSIKELDTDIYRELIITYKDILKMSEVYEIYEISGSIHKLLKEIEILEKEEYDF